MPEADPLSLIPHLFHFTDRRNLPLIRDMGGLYPLSELERRGVNIPAPGSSESGRDVDRRRKLHEYVHLCFKSNHPMEFVARQPILKCRPDNRARRLGLVKNAKWRDDPATLFAGCRIIRLANARGWKLNRLH